jgi:uncharacterized protein (TIGR02145 family)
MHLSEKIKIKSLKVLAAVFIVIVFSSACKKEEEKLMVVRNDSISAITSTSAIVHSTIIDIGNGIDQHGHCWSANEGPTLEDNENMSEMGPVSVAGPYTSTMQNLMPNTKYYTRAYIKNSGSVAYSNNILSFNTLQAGLPVVTTGSIEDLTSSSAIVGGSLNSLGEGVSSVLQHGHCWSSVTATPTIDTDNKSSLGTRASTGTFQSLLVGLTPDVLYYVRAYATNSAGTAYGSFISFSTPPQAGLPVLTTLVVTSITETTAQSGGNITNDSGSEVTARGVCWNTSENPTISDAHTNDGIGTGEFASEITGLTPNTNYYVRAYATNSIGTAYGPNEGFTTAQEPGLPVLTTDTVSSITETTAVCGGNITDNGGSEVTARGVCWNTSENPTLLNSHTEDGTGTGSFTSYITGLAAGTGYYVRAYATNIAGTSYGKHMSFKTISGGSSQVSDYDGNTYSTVHIGEQIWMAENLKTTHYSDGTPLVNGTGVTEISGDYTTKYWFVYGDNPVNKDTYGLLYTWAAVMNEAPGSESNPSGVQGVCPTGWHVPSDAEWKQMEIYLGMDPGQADNDGWRGTGEGGKLKEAGYTNWNSPNTSATNSSGFTALGGGHRTNANSYTNMKTGANFWSATNTVDQAWTRLLLNDNAAVYRWQYVNNFGLSVRCVKNE